MTTLEASASATGNNGEAARQVGFLPFTHQGRLERACPFFVFVVDLFVKKRDKGGSSKEIIYEYCTNCDEEHR
tara:strand:+ start:4030 stop:4248 length:219 start_codon:yes stop_codon:yes gene_type:complete